MPTCIFIPPPPPPQPTNPERKNWKKSVTSAVLSRKIPPNTLFTAHSRISVRGDTVCVFIFRLCFTIHDSLSDFTDFAFLWFYIVMWHEQHMDIHCVCVCVRVCVCVCVCVCVYFKKKNNNCFFCLGALCYHSYGFMALDTRWIYLLCLLSGSILS